MLKNPNEISGIFEGKIWPITLKLSIPIFIGQFIHTLYLICDSVFISFINRAETAYISGTGIVMPIFFLFMAIGIGLTVGISALVSRGIGEKNQLIINRAADSGLIIALAISTLSLLFGLFFGKQIILKLAGSELTELALENSIDYFRYLLPGLGIMLIAQMFMGILQGEGKMKPIAIATSISTILNLILDPLLIFKAGMGVKGAGLATSISMTFNALFMIMIFIRKKSSIPIKWNLCNASPELIKEIFRIGIFQSIGMMLLSVSFFVLNNFVSSISEIWMNAWSIVGRSDQILLIPAFAISSATITMIGQNYGRGQLERVKNIYKTNIGLAVLAIIMMSIIYILIAPLFFRIFSTRPDVISKAVYQVRVLSFTFSGIAVAIISSAAFQATGRPILMLIIRIIRIFFIVIPLAILFFKKLDMGINGIFISLITGNIIVFLLSWIWTTNYLGKLKFRKAV